MFFFFFHFAYYDIENVLWKNTTGREEKRGSLLRVYCNEKVQVYRCVNGSRCDITPTSSSSLLSAPTLSSPFLPSLSSYQLDADTSIGVDLVKVEDELGQIFDRVDVVVGRGRNQGNPGFRRTKGCDVLGDLGPRELTALPRLGALAHLNLDLVVCFVSRLTWEQ